MIDLLQELKDASSGDFNDWHDGWFSWHIDSESPGTATLELRFEPRDEELHRPVVEHWKMERV